MTATHYVASTEIGTVPCWPRASSCHEFRDARPKPLASTCRRGSLCRQPNDGCGKHTRDARDCRRVRQACAKSRRSCQDTWQKRHQRCCCAACQNRLVDLDWLSPSPGLIQKHNGLKDGQQRGINAASSGVLPHRPGSWLGCLRSDACFKG
jgi:hypothetical protein